MKTAFKAAALLSSVVLVGGYVFLRAGGGGGLFPSSKSGRISRTVVDDEPLVPATAPAAESVSTAATRPRLMPGSKSAHAFEADDNVIFGDAQPATKPGNPR